jgi:hypothetical protein
MIQIMFLELPTYKPGEVWTWWAYPKNHMRFKGIKQSQITLAHEMLYNFLARYARGELNKDGTVKKQRR